MFKKVLAAFAGFLASVGIAFAAVDINTADKAALDTVKGVGPVIADKIIAERKIGKFKDWDDMIKRVNGIGPATAAEMSGTGATVDGKSFKGVAAPKAADKAKEKPAAAAGKTDKPEAAAGKTAEKAVKADKPTKDEAKKDKPSKEDAKKEKATKANAKEEAKKDAPTKDAKKDEKPKS